MPMLITLLVLDGDIADPDRNAHDMWANQLINTGKLVISQNGTYDNWLIYYPNTVPKPIELIIGFLRYPGGKLFDSIITFFMCFLVIVSAWYAAGKGTQGLQVAMFLGFNPVFILLGVTGSSAISFLGFMFLLQSAKGSNAGVILASLSRPEGFLYGGYFCVKKRKWKLLALLLATGIVWLIFHKITCGSFSWASDEVRYSVAAMNYPTANIITFFPWSALRLIMVLGAPAAAILFITFRRWKLHIPFSANFILLTISLTMGSLVLPRYIDQLFLLAAPFIFIEIHRLFKGRIKTSLIIAVLVFPWFQWIYVIPEIQEYQKLEVLYSSFQLPESGVTAVNELIIPGLCLNLDIDDPSGLFVSTDKAAWSYASEIELEENEVTKIVIFPTGVYFPVHTEKWLETIKDIEVLYFQ